MSFLRDAVEKSGAVSMLSRGNRRGGFGQMVEDGAGASTRNMAAPRGRRGFGGAMRRAAVEEATGAAPTPRRDGSGRGRRRGLFGRAIDRMAADGKIRAKR